MVRPMLSHPGTRFPSWQISLRWLRKLPLAHKLIGGLRVGIWIAKPGCPGGLTLGCRRIAVFGEIVLEGLAVAVAREARSLPLALLVVGHDLIVTPFQGTFSCKTSILGERLVNAAYQQFHVGEHVVSAARADIPMLGTKLSLLRHGNFASGARDS